MAHKAAIWVLLAAQVAMGARAMSTVSETRSAGGGRAGDTFNVMDYGAVGDGIHKDTAAIVAAVAAVAAAGSGTVLFPSGGRFLTGPFNMTSHCTLYIDANATLLGSTDKDDWPMIPALPSYGQGKHGGPARRTSLIHGENLTDVVVTGNNGTIDGQGAAWWHHKHDDDTPPHMIEFMWSSDIEVSHLTLTNTAFWTVHPVYCVGFVAHHLWILNPQDVSNTDGIDPDSTRDVLIHDVYIRTGDDGIAMKSGWDEYGYDFLGHGLPTQNVTIRNAIISTPCAAIAIGSEMSGGVRDVTVSNCTLWDSTAGVHIKSGRGRGGFVTDVVLEDITMDGVHCGFMFDTDSDKKPQDSPGHHANMSALPDIRRIATRRVRGTNCDQVARLQGLDAAHPMADISFDDVRFNALAAWPSCVNVTGTWVSCIPKPCSALTPAAAGQ